ncbi:hypothetical protein [Agrobacterium sp. NPDC090283]|uniref:hypothetical protein n=1 Tax=Agrobacterium sp. NPDC090283 TaxID=3363920 RepID=UPI00383B723B
MSKAFFLTKFMWSMVVAGVASTPAYAEFQCSPLGATPNFPVSDSFFPTEMAAWALVTRSRYLEGGGNCEDVTVPGYEGFPTKRCVYASADAGKKAFPPLRAQVILLQPSAQQLASWSVQACRAVGANDSQMPTCLAELRSHVISSNGAQFAVAGSVVESRCNSSRAYPNGCSGLNDTDKGRQPRNTWFRNGVAVDYTGPLGIKWDEKAYSDETYEDVFDVSKSDKFLGKTYTKARIAAAIREDWALWRTHLGKPLMMADTIEADLEGSGWQSISREVHKAACKSGTNELFDAVVYSHRHKWVR